MIALTAMVLAGTSASAQTAVSEAEARCFVDGICEIAAEKKFSIAKIDSKAKPAAAPVMARPTSVRATGPVGRPTRLASRTPSRSEQAALVRPSLNMRMTFELNSATLTPEAQAQADVFAKVLKDSSGGGAFLIEGHTDTIGSRTANLDLSRRRARSVVTYLVDRGVPQTKLKAVGYGFDRPRDGLAASHPDNRRVEIVKN